MPSVATMSTCDPRSTTWVCGAAEIRLIARSTVRACHLSDARAQTGKNEAPVLTPNRRLIPALLDRPSGKTSTSSRLLQRRF